LLVNSLSLWVCFVKIFELLFLLQLVGFLGLYIHFDPLIVFFLVILACFQFPLILILIVRR
jgi:hypothetical protein